MTDHCKTDFLSMMDNMLGPSPMHIKYVSYVYDRFCIWQTNFPGPIESVISKFTWTVFLRCSLRRPRNSWTIGMGTVENSTVRFGFRFCLYGSVLSRFPKRFINDISWIRNYAMECVAELAWTCKFLYTSSLASFSMLRRLLSIVKVAREQEAPFIVTLKWLFDRRTWQT